MRVANCVPLRKADGTAPSARELQGIAAAVEESGFSGIWIGDAVARGRGIFPDPFSWLAVAATATDNIDLGTAVMEYPVRNPVELAQRFLTLHAISNGRFIAGVGTGSTETDFLATGSDFAHRFRDLREYLKVIRRLCKGEQVEQAKYDPWSNAVGGPRIMIGSWVSPRWISRAAKQYDGWIASGGGPAGRSKFGTLREGIAQFRDEGGKRASLATVWVDFSQESPPLADDTGFHLRCPPAEALERLQAAADLGFDEVILRRDTVTADEVREHAALLRVSGEPVQA